MHYGAAIRQLPPITPTRGECRSARQQALVSAGYTSRLAGRYQTSLEAYERGLKVPWNADGMSGLAQTYERMGARRCKRLLAQVIRANPNRTNDLLMPASSTCARETRKKHQSFATC